MRGPLLPISTPRLMALEWSGALGTAVVFFLHQLEFKSVNLDGWRPFLGALMLLGGIVAILGPLLAIALACPGVPSKRERRIRLGATLAMVVFVYGLGCQAAVVLLAFVPEERGGSVNFPLPR